MNEFLEVLKDECEKMAARIDDPYLSEMFRKCFINTAETTTQVLDDGTSFVFTGDIPAMWLRDSSAQVRHYVPFAKKHQAVAEMIKGLILRQADYICLEPYANAFNKEPNNKGMKADKTKQNPWVWERKYEIDSLCYPMQLAYLYWKATDDVSIFTQKFENAVCEILNLWTKEQNHFEKTDYRFERFNAPKTDTLPMSGLGRRVNRTGMTWSGFRPSDDSCIFGYLIPANMFAAVVLGYITDFASAGLIDEKLGNTALNLKNQIDDAINVYGIYAHPKYGKIYAYETDGFGNYNLMDDANVPSLLSIPYLGYKNADDEIYKDTRKFILSDDNPYFFKGKYAAGVGSPHTGKNLVWHIALSMQVLTSKDDDEISSIINMLKTTDAQTGYMHESFNPDNPKDFTRPWFAWSNSLFSEMLMKVYHLI